LWASGLLVGFDTWIPSCESSASEGFITKKERRPKTLKKERRIEQLRGRGGLRGGSRGGEGRRRRRKGKKGGSIGKRNRRREGISRARAIPSKGSTREKRRQGKARNSKKTHYSSLGNCLSNTRWDLPIAYSTKLGTSRRIEHRGKTLASKLRIMLSEFEVSKGEQTPDCSRAERTKAGDDKCKESKADGGIEICMLSVLDLLLHH
jgi:hypothetical protein